jgi:hypothetical protein
MIRAFLMLQLRLRAMDSLNLGFFGLAVPLYMAFLGKEGARKTGMSGNWTGGILLFSSSLLILRALGHAMDVDRMGGVLRTLGGTRFRKKHYLASRWIESHVVGLLPLGAWLMLDSQGRHAIAFPGLLTYFSWICTLFAGAALVLAVSRPPLSIQLVNLVSLLIPTLFPVFYDISRVPAKLWGLLRWLPPGLAVQGMSPSSGVLEPMLLALWAIVLTLLASAFFPWNR